jgi:protoheme IX farnesyltransferase
MAAKSLTMGADESRAGVAGFARDLAQLAKPRITGMVVFTFGAGLWLAPGTLGLGRALIALLGTTLIVAGANAINQYLERDIDGFMERTRNRPLPAGRLQAAEVLLVGTLLGVAGTAYLALTLSRPWAAVVAALTFALYVGAYTPLKRRTPLNTLVGAVPGALPPVIGWCAVRGGVGLEAFTLFVILFLWQVPHFLAIAWIYRDEYARAGLCMLPGLDPGGALTARHVVTYCLALIPASLAPVVLGSAGVAYLGGALLLGLGFLASGLRFRRRRSAEQARRVLRASLLYLPGLLALLLLDRTLPWLVLGR